MFSVIGKVSVGFLVLYLLMLLYMYVPMIVIPIGIIYIAFLIGDKIFNEVKK